MIDYSNYKLWERESIYQEKYKDHPEPNYAITWEDPNEPDSPMKITIPSPVWLGMAMHGGILPPVEVYWELKKDEADPNFKRHTRGHLLHDTKPCDAMTEEEAMEYLIMKDIPPHVWYSYKGNREIIRIVPRDKISINRDYRNAWRVSQIEENYDD